MTNVPPRSMLVEVLTGLLDTARTAHDLREREAAYREAARVLDTHEIEALDPDVRQHLFTLYAEAHMIATGALVP